MEIQAGDLCRVPCEVLHLLAGRQIPQLDHPITSTRHHPEVREGRE